MFNRVYRQESVLHVPPGLGKNSTHARNERRRRKRQAEKAAAASASGGSTLAGSSEANAVPLGPRIPEALIQASTSGSSAQQDEGIEEGVEGGISVVADGDAMQVDEDPKEGGEGDRYMMASLRNKNKKKGFFKQSMMKGLENGSKAKIVFGGEEGTREQVSVNKAKAAVQEAEPSRASHRPRLVPPSELQAMGKVPKNLFVTSVDVEEGMWDGQQGQKRKKNRKGKAAAEEEVYYEDPDQFADAEEEVTLLDYGGGEPEVDWAKVEMGWNNYAVLVDKGQLEAGKLVGWKVSTFLD